MGFLDAFERRNTPSRAELLEEQRAEDAERAFEEAGRLVKQARDLMADFQFEYSAAYEAIGSAAVELGQ